ncbi:hypothetical protein PUN28_000523 [Cardiocondyla obscurior]|uniref:Uncharacterized protein n=1 Tax=Cardiocondyla obscurior TaxID=286306 RepID=A0AAW2GZX9_9HYME
MEKMNVEVENTKPPARKETAAQQQPCPSCKGAAAQQQRPNESTSQQPRLILSIKRNETGHSSPLQEVEEEEEQTTVEMLKKKIKDLEEKLNRPPRWQRAGQNRRGGRGRGRSRGASKRNESKVQSWYLY